jgi:hypothetical protein
MADCLPHQVRKPVADALRAMGTAALRVGGSFASVTGWPDSHRMGASHRWLLRLRHRLAGFTPDGGGFTPDGGGFTPDSTVSGTYYQWQLRGPLPQL